jgi:transketolase
MSLAPAAYLLFQRILRHDPADPGWLGRDRFVLSCGHSSLTLYLQLYLSGYGLTLDDIKGYRSWGSLTPGHPEHGLTPGVETTTGPLGQGLGNAVGMAMAARRERGLLDPGAPAGTSPFDHHVYCFVSDGDIEEGISHEASALAAHQDLGNLVVLYDNNTISIEDDTAIAKSEDVCARYEAYGWHVQRVTWRHPDGYREDVGALRAALTAARDRTGQPSLISLRTIIAWPAPTKQDTGEAHGSALGAEEVAATKRILGFDPDVSFPVEEDVIAHARMVADRAKRARAEWEESFAAWAAANPDGAALLSRLSARRLPDGWEAALPRFQPDAKGMATRKASGETLNALAPVLPELWGGSADLAGSNNTSMKGEPSFIPPEHQTRLYPGGMYGRTLHFGIREHAMGAICSGIALHGLTRPYGGTFLVFSDYMRPAVRLAAMMGLPVTYVWTHDSIGLGEDGPTHQPVEHLWALRWHPRAGRRAPGRRQRDRGRLAGHPQPQRPARWPVPHPAERAGVRPCRRPRAGPGRGRAGRGGGHRPRRVHPGRGRRRGAGGDPDRHRQRGAGRARGTRTARAGDDHRPGRLDAMRGMVHRARAFLPGGGAPGAGPGPGLRRSWHCPGMAGICRRCRGMCQLGALWCLGRLPGAVREVRVHGGAGGGRGPRQPGQGGAGRPSLRARGSIRSERP